MSDPQAYDDPNALAQPTEGNEKPLDVRFSGKFLDTIDTLVNNLIATVNVPDRDEARRLAVATAVVVLSKYAGQRLYVDRHGRPVVIEDLWRR